MGSHSILDYDELRILTSLGHDVFSLTGYIEPATPHEDKRPGLDLPNHPDLKAHVDAIGAPDNLGAAKEHLPDAILEWADIIICAAYEWKWLYPQWKRIKGKRVIWRTIGQSLEPNERLMAPLFRDGLEIVRYSPKERNIPGYAGESAVIRFGKDPLDWHGWTGEWQLVTNVSQHMAARADACNLWFWQEATKDLTTTQFTSKNGVPSLSSALHPIGPGSELIGGTGPMDYDQMRLHLRRCRAYLYTGTKPACYTLGLIEAMMTGVPIVSIGRRAFGGGTYLDDVFEAHEFVISIDNPATARQYLTDALARPDAAVSFAQRQRAIEMFGIVGITEQWGAFLAS